MPFILTDANDLVVVTENEEDWSLIDFLEVEDNNLSKLSNRTETFKERTKARPSYTAIRRKRKTD